MRPGFDYVVQAGDCISSIAQACGFFWQTIWDANPQLKSVRKNPNVLFAGDVLKIPDSVERNESCASDNTHTFVKRGTPAKFRLMIERYNVPLSNRRYLLEIDGETFRGRTDRSGLLEVPISPLASSGRLRLPDDHLECELALGYLDPVTELVGVQQRLQNLGFLQRDPDGEMDDEVGNALMEFQSSVNLPATGELDDATREKLLNMHDEVHSHPTPHDEVSDDAPGQEASQPEEIPADIDPAEDDAEMARFTSSDYEDDGLAGEGTLDGDESQQDQDRDNDENSSA